MKALIEAMRDDVEQQRAAAVPIYRALLHRGGDRDFTDADKAEFKRVAELLGKDLTAVAADFKIVQEAFGWREVGDTAAKEEEAYAAAYQAHQDFLKEAERVRAELVQRNHVLYAAQLESASRRANAYNARERLDRMKQQHAAILLGIDCAAYEPPAAPDTPVDPYAASAEKGGPFEIRTPVPDFDGVRFGVRFDRGVGRTDLVHAANLCETNGYTVRDLSKEPTADAEAAGTVVTVTTDVAGPPAAEEEAEAAGRTDAPRRRARAKQ